jgi:hypothetical protein
VIIQGKKINRVERSSFESQITPERQPAKLPEEEHVNVELEEHRAAFENNFSETKSSETQETLSLSACGACAVYAVCVWCVMCAVRGVQCSVITMRICFCVSLSAALATHANITIKTIADFILAHSQPNEHEPKEKRK